MPVYSPYQTHTEIAVNGIQSLNKRYGVAVEGQLSYLNRIAPEWMHNIANTEARPGPRTSAPIKLVNPLNYPQLQSRSLSARGREELHILETIDNGHKSESIFSQTTGKYTDLINKEGFSFICKEIEPVQYLKRRFVWMSAVMNHTVNALIKETSRDYVKYGNAYWIKSRVKDQPLVIGGKRLIPAVDLHNKPELGVIGGYFRADPPSIEPRYHKTSGRHIGWIQHAEGRVDKSFTLEEVIHFSYQKPAGGVLGMSMYYPVIDDVRSLRDVEEYNIKLFYKHLFPIIHHEIPAVGDDHYGTAEEIEQAAGGYAGISPDGIIITPPDHKISIIGAEGKALDGTNFLNYLMSRAFMGLGTSKTIMGVEDTTAASADVLTTQIHDRVKSFQQDLEEVLNLRVVLELLIEGGFDPLHEEDEWALLEFNEIELEAQIKFENHVINLWTNGLITEDEARVFMKRNPIMGAQRRKKYIYTDKIPVIEAQTGCETDGQKEVLSHKLFTDKALATHNHQLDVKKDLVTGAGGQPSTTVTKTSKAATGSSKTTSVKQIHAPAISTRLGTNKNPTGTGPANKVKSISSPSNQYGTRSGPRISSRPAAGAASKKKARSASLPPSVKG